MIKKIASLLILALVSASTLRAQVDLEAEFFSLPDTVTAIGDRAFAGHDHMNSATLNDGLQSIGHKIFKDCEYLMFVELPDSLLEAEDDAFDGASDDMALILNVKKREKIRFLTKESPIFIDRRFTVLYY